MTDLRGFGSLQQRWQNTRSIQFNGTTQYLSRAGLTGLPAAHTWFGWFKSAMVGIRYVLSIGSDANNREYVSHSGATIGYHRHVGGAVVSVTGVAVANVWTAFTCTRDATGLGAFFLDGAPVGVPILDAGTIPSPSPFLSVGSFWTGVAKFSGRISQVALLSGALPAPQVAWLAARPWYDLRARPDFVWGINPMHIQDNTSGLIHDWSPTGQHLTPLNTPTIVDDAP
ncbi:MAG: LamG-like jellyroll fold domain-containing protein [Gemmatimonadota bacterium]